jgi:hypothetical protein
MKNTVDVTDGKPIAVLYQSISGVTAINHLVAFYDNHGGKRDVRFFYFVLDITRDHVGILDVYKQIFKREAVFHSNIVIDIALKNHCSLYTSPVQPKTCIGFLT